jgi:hypothetical protein
MYLDLILIALAVGIYIGWMVVWSFHFIALIYSCVYSNSHWGIVDLINLMSSC